MNIPNELRKDQTTPQRLKIARYILENEAYFDELMSVFFSNKYRLQQRSAWIMGNVVLKKPYLLDTYYQPIIKKITLPDTTDSFKRNVVRVWQEVELPEKFLGEIYDCCFNFLLGKEAIAIKAFSMTVCYKITLKFPDLKPELLAAIEEVVLKDGSNSKGILSRGYKTIRLLKKDLNIL